MSVPKMQSRAGGEMRKSSENKQGLTGTLVTLGKSLVSRCLSFLLGNLRKIIPLASIVRLTWNKICESTLQASKGTDTNERAFVIGFNPTGYELQALKIKWGGVQVSSGILQCLVSLLREVALILSLGPSAFKTTDWFWINCHIPTWKAVRAGSPLYLRIYLWFCTKKWQREL